MRPQRLSSPFLCFIAHQLSDHTMLSIQRSFISGYYQLCTEVEVLCNTIYGSQICRRSVSVYCCQVMPLPDCAVIQGVNRLTHFKVCGSDSYVIYYHHVRLLSGRVVCLKLVEGIYLYGAWGSVVVKALRYQSDGPRINSR